MPILLLTNFTIKCLINKSRYIIINLTQIYNYVMTLKDQFNHLIKNHTGNINQTNPTANLH